MAQEKRQEGQKPVFEKEAVELLDLMYGLALRLCRNPSQAEDLVHDTYIKAWRYQDSFRLGTSLKAWLFSILKNTFLNEIKRGKFIDSHVVIEDLPLKSQNKEYGDDQYSDEVKLALDALPKKQRMVLLLADVEEWSYQEIGQALQCPKNTVGTLLKRARDAMKKMIQKQEGRKERP
jgi:RNA polymerase sigma-70 factor (ECF subfamily)